MCIDETPLEPLQFSQPGPVGIVCWCCIFGPGSRTRRERPHRLSEKLIAGPAYYFAGITPVLDPHVPQVTLAGLDDLRPYKIGNRPSSIGDLMTMAYKKGVLIQNVQHVDARLDPLDALSRSELDVTLTEAHKFDVYLAAHPQSALRASGLMLPVGFNIGFVGTQAHAGLLGEIETAIATLLENGALHKAAQDTGLTYIPPASPAVGAGLGLEKMTQ